MIEAGIIDTNVSLHRWPFRRFPGDDPADLVARLREKGVTQAWAGTFDGLLHLDITAANSRLAADCRPYRPGFLLPFGSINPMLPDWQEDLRQCHQLHRMPGIRLHPNYHGYDLNSPVFGEVLAAASGRRMLVQLVCCMEDERTQNPRMQVPVVDLAPLPLIVRRTPELRLLILNWRTPLTIDLARQLAEAGNVYFDFAMVEGIGGVERLRQRVSGKRIVFGSHVPFFYFESAVLKVQESALSLPDEKSVLFRNAQRILSAPH